MTEHEFLTELTKGNGSVLTDSNIKWLNDMAYELYNKPDLNKEEQSRLKDIIESCNILYDRTDMSILPIEDGFYDILLEKYKTYDEHFQVGSAVVDFNNSDQIICRKTFPNVRAYWYLSNGMLYRKTLKDTTTGTNPYSNQDIRITCFKTIMLGKEKIGIIMNFQDPETGLERRIAIPLLLSNGSVVQ